MFLPRATLLVLVIIGFSRTVSAGTTPLLSRIAPALRADTALIHAEERLAAAVTAKKWPAAATACFDIATIHYDKFRYDQAIQYNLQGIGFARKTADAKSEAAHLTSIGITYYAKYDYALAMEYCLKALKLTEKLNDPETVIRLNNRIGMIYKYLEDYDKALEYFLPALKESKRLKTGPINDLLINIGNVKQVQQHYQESIQYYQEYLKLRPSAPLNQVISYNNIGKVYLDMHELDKAGVYFRRAYQVEDTVVNPRGRAYSMYNFATLSQVRGDYREAIAYGTRCLTEARRYRVKSLEWQMYNLLADCHQKAGNYELANMYLGKYIVLKDSIFARKSIDRIHVSDVAYRVELETEKKQQEIYTLNKENSLKQLQVANLNKEKTLNLLQLRNLRQNDSLSQLKLENYNKASLVTAMQMQSLEQQNQLKSLDLSVQRRNQLLMVISTAISLFAFIYFYRRYRFKKLQELEKIRSGIAADFHDELGSTLSSIALYSEMAIRDDLADTQRTKSILSLIGESSRGTVSAMQDMIWTIHPKNDNMHEVVYRMREYALPLAEVKNIALTLHVDDGVQQLDLPMDLRKNIYLVFKEALNNSFKYAAASAIAIALTRQRNSINLEISDDGSGFDPLRIKPGNGLRNMHKRADQSGGRLDVESVAGKGTRIVFNCPLSRT